MSSPAVSHEQSEIQIAVTGLTVGGIYTLWRCYKRWDGATDWEYEKVLGATAYRATSSTAWLHDPIAPHNRSIYYVLKRGEIEVARTGTVTMNWQSLDDDPWSLLNERPILRDPYRTTPYVAAHPDTTRPYARLVVTEFEANWETRGQKVSIIGSKYPVIATDQRELKSGAFTVITADYRTLKPNAGDPPWTAADYAVYPAALQRENLLNLLQTTRLLHLRGWCVDGFQNLFLVPGSIEETVPFPSRPDIREWRIEYQQVRDPATYLMPRWAAGWGDFVDLAALAADFASLSLQAGTFEALAAAVDPIAGPMQADQNAPRTAQEWL
jgi:hypothetical protein